ncbi:hypothetical protein HAP94_17020 [Acidithiobacillus ferrivorans]|nr:hypothetical protein [Acidithiobacillus ferrivorans]
MMPAQIIVEIAEEGGEIRLEGGRLKVKGVPARLVPLIREHKSELLALLSAPAADDYPVEERLAIQSEDDLPPDRGFDDIAGFEGMPDLTAEEHGEILHQLMNPPPQSPAPAKSTTDATQAPTMQPEPVTAPLRPFLAPKQPRCADCLHVAPATGQEAGVRYCNITKSHNGPDRHMLCWGFQVRTCSRFEVKP